MRTHVINLQRGMQKHTNRTTLRVTAYTRWEAALVQAGHNPGLFPPTAADPLPGQAWNEVTFSKVCLSRDDMWMCWHEAPLSAPHHCISRPCQKSSCGCFLSPIFFFSFPPKCGSQPEKTDSLFVLMVVPFLRFILTEKYQQSREQA